MGALSNDAGHDIPFRAAYSGFVAACGPAVCGWAALAALAGHEPTGLDSITALVGRRGRARAARAQDGELAGA
jgi:hypothetical protein